MTNVGYQQHGGLYAITYVPSADQPADRLIL